MWEKKFITEVCTNGHKEPNWQKIFEIDVRNKFKHNFELTVISQGALSSYTIGENLNILAVDLCQPEKVDQWFPIFFKEKEAG